MFEFFARQDFKLPFHGALFFVSGFVLYQLTQQKKALQEEIKQIQKAKIYDGKSILAMKSQERQKLLSKDPQRSFLMKFPSKNIKLYDGQRLQHIRDVYTNQIYFCPPSTDPMLKATLFELNYLNGPTLQTIILTNRFQWKAQFQPRKKYHFQSETNTSFIQKFQNLLLFSRQIFYSFMENLFYYSQKFLDRISFKKQEKRSFNTNRSPFFKGVWAGVLTVNFNLLKDAYFLVKVKIEGDQIDTELIADNKQMIIEYYKLQIVKSNFFTIFPLMLFFLSGSVIYRRIRSKIKKLFFRMTTLDKKILNPFGISDDKLCQICYINCRNVLLYKCRHFIVCEDCYLHLQKPNCIMCNAHVQKAQILFSKTS